MLRSLILSLAAWAAGLAATLPAAASDPPEISAGFHSLYELKFEGARAQFEAWRRLHPEDPLGETCVAASYLFEEFYQHRVLTSEFFLDDKRLLGGIDGRPDEKRRAAFMAANERAQELARRQLMANPKDAGALFALTLSAGMRADYAGLIEKRQFESLRLIREAQGYAKTLLAVAPDSADAYVALGVGNYIVGSLPVHKRVFLWFGGVHGDRLAGMQQLEIAARNGHYLRPFAKTLLALVALREKREALARSLLEQLTAEFPQNPLFAREVAKLNGSLASYPADP